MSRITFAVAFTLGVLAFVYGEPRVRHWFNAFSTRSSAELFTSPQDGYCYSRSERMTAGQVSQWKREVETESSQTRFALFSLGLYRSYVHGDYRGAVTFLERVQREYPSTSLAAAALFETGVALVHSGDGEQSLRAFELFCTRYPHSWRVPAALMYVSMYHQENGDIQRACDILEGIGRDYSFSQQSFRAIKMAMKLYEEQGLLDESARLSLLIAGRCRSSLKAAQALVRWAELKAVYIGGSATLKKLDLYIGLMKSQEARRLVLECALKIASKGGLDEYELTCIERLLEIGIQRSRQPVMLWRLYELESGLSKDVRARKTLNRLVRDFPDTREGSLAASEIGKVMAAGIIK